MEYLMETKGEATVVRFDGDLGGSDEGDLKKMFIELRREGATKVAVDMTRVDFMDSTVIGLFVWGMKNLREVGGDFRLFGLTDAVRKIFEITHLDRAFEILPCESDALESFL